jgi:L-malate glycosyltransferase
MLTVTIASHNGATTLPRVLEAYAAAAAPAGGWQLLLVDNASTDETPAIVQRFTTKLPLVYLREPRPGKNRALNTAVPHFAGELVVFSDDDAIPAPDFLVRWSEVTTRHLEYAMFGGAIRPAWSRPAPKWLLDSEVSISVAFAVTPSDQPEGPISPDGVWGPNMAVRHEVFRQGFRFDEMIGPKGRSYPMGSEVSFTNRLYGAGYRAWFLPGIVVEHVIRAHQLERAWIRQRAINFGRGMYRRNQRAVDPDNQRLWRGIPVDQVRERLRRLPGLHRWLLAALMRHDSKELVGAEWHTCIVYGYFYELLVALREGSSDPPS